MSTKGANTEVRRNPTRGRKQSDKDKEKEKRRSVSDIAQIFKTQVNSPKAKSTPTKANDSDKSIKTATQTEIDSNRVNPENCWEEQLTQVIANKEMQMAEIDHDKDTEEIALNGNASLNTEKHFPLTSKEATITSKKDAITQSSDDLLRRDFSVLQKQLKALEDKVDDPRNGLLAQLAKTQDRVQEMYSDINGAVGGIKVKLETVIKTAADNAAKMAKFENSQLTVTTLLEENKRLISELRLMQGLVQKVSQQTSHANNQILNLTKRGMEQNLVFHGIDNTIEIEDAKAKQPMFSRKERCQQSVMSFCKDYLDVDLEPGDVWKAHRMGPFKQDKMRPMVVKLAYSAKDLIMEHISKLKGKKNPNTQQTFFVSEQIPEGLVEAKKQLSAQLKTLKEKNEARPAAERQHIQVISDKILINDQVELPEVQPPQPSQLFLDARSQARINQIQAQLLETDPFTVKNSEFTALSLRVNTVQEVNDAYVAVYQRYPAADHIMAAYALKHGQILKQGSCDDGEHGASNRIKRLIFEEHSKNTAIFVVRKYGGVHLGFGRFAAIEQVTRNALSMLNKDA